MINSFWHYQIIVNHDMMRPVFDSQAKGFHGFTSQTRAFEDAKQVLETIRQKTHTEYSIFSFQTIWELIPEDHQVIKMINRMYSDQINTEAINQ